MMPTSDFVAEGCEFCAIARGRDRTADIIAEGQGWIAFFPHEPATAGHTLVIPRAHVPNLWAVESELGSALMEAVVRVGRAIDRAVKPDGMNLITSSGEAAEQTVFHLHLHLVPRWTGDGFGRIWPPDHHTPERVKDDLAARIREAYN